MPTEACQEEFEALSAIFLDDEIKIEEGLENDSARFTMVLYPATGDDKESKYVTLTLELTLPKDYPKVSPIIRFRNPRGLSESLLDTLYRTMNDNCNEKLESQMIFELVDMGKEFLTINNRPSAECPICLLSITSTDTFFRSQCFHHFHSYCLGRYLHNLQEAAKEETYPGDVPGKSCPVCREAMEDIIDIQKLLDSAPPFEDSLEVLDSDAILKEWHAKQNQLQTLFEKQKSQGGIIDLEELNKKRLVITTQRDNADSESPSSSSDGGLDVDSLGAVGIEQASIPVTRNIPRVDPKLKALQYKNKTVVERSLSSQNSQTKQQQSSKPGQAPQPKPPQQPKKQEDDPAPTEKTLTNNEPQEEHRHHRRGKSGYQGHSRRRYK